MNNEDKEYPKEIEFAIYEDQYTELMEGLADAIQTRHAMGNIKEAASLSNIQKVLRYQKWGQEYFLKQAKEILKIK